MTEKELKLFQIATGSAAELCARAAKIVRPDVECKGTGVPPLPHS
jgi:hypothetical protein